MMNDLVKTVKAFLAQKNAVESRERQLIEDLNRVLPEIGYRVVPAERAQSAPETPAPVMRNGDGSSTVKLLACPHCDRRFARPLHLGRHIAATHSRAQSRSQSRPHSKKKKAA